VASGVGGLDLTHWLALLALVGTGFIASALNVVAGGGSFLTLPLLIFLGLPTTDANATNRIGILVQNLGGVVGFHSHGVLDWRWAARASASAVLGAAVGVYLALQIGERPFRRILAVLMLALTLVSLLDPGARLAGRFRALASRRRLLALGFFAVGIYAGFIQAGVGFLVLALTTLAGLDLVRGNAIKVFVILLTTIVSLLLFAAVGRIVWAPGLALAAGSLAGSLAGVRLTVVLGHAWVRFVVATIVVLLAVKLWLP
jgi:hypothetical protein